MASKNLEWYDFKRTLKHSQGAYGIIIIGERDDGKTVSVKDWIISDYIKNKNKTLWIRGSKDDVLNESKKFLLDQKYIFKDTKKYNNFEMDSRFVVEHKAKKINPVAELVPFSYAGNFKGSRDPMIKTIVLDEFHEIPQKFYRAQVKYISTWIGTYGLRKPDFKFIAMGNSDTLNVPFLISLGIYDLDPKKEFHYIKNDNGKVVWMVHYYRRSKAHKKKKYGDDDPGFNLINSLSKREADSVFNNEFKDSKTFIIPEKEWGQFCNNNNYVFSLYRNGKTYHQYKIRYIEYYTHKKHHTKPDKLVAFNKKDTTKELNFIAQGADVIHRNTATGSVRFSSIAVKADIFSLWTTNILD